MQQNIMAEKDKIMKKSGFKMKGYSYPGVSPMQKDKKMWDGNGNQVIVDDKELGKKSHYDEDLGVNWRYHNFIIDGKEQQEILYENKPGGEKNPFKDPEERLYT